MGDRVVGGALGEVVEEGVGGSLKVARVGLGRVAVVPSSSAVVRSGRSVLESL